jgi:hypothetical protein
MSEPMRMTKAEVEATVRGLRQSTEPSKALDGARVHVYYKTMPGAKPATDRAKEEAKRAEVLGIERQRYTGTVGRVFSNKSGELCVCVRVELERASADGTACFRTFNVDKGDVVAIVVLG